MVFKRLKDSRNPSSLAGRSLFVFLMVSALWLLLAQAAAARPVHGHAGLSLSPFDQQRHSRHCLLHHHSSTAAPEVCPHMNTGNSASRLVWQADCSGAAGKGLPAGGNHFKDFPATDPGSTPLSPRCAGFLVDALSLAQDGPAHAIDPPPRL